MTLMSDANAIIRADRAEIDRLRAEKAELLAALESAVGDIGWMSGSADFSDGGKARAGWLKVCDRLMGYRAAIKKAKAENGK